MGNYNVGLSKYVFPWKLREAKLREFINLKKVILSVEEYPLKFSTLHRYALSLVSNPRYEMSHFVTEVVYLVMEEFHTAMFHDDMTLARLMVYAQSIEDSKLRRTTGSFKRSGARSLKRSGATDKEQTRFKKKVQSQ